MKIKKMAAGVLAAVLMMGGLIFGFALPASAHTGTVTGVANCEADGTYTVTWTYTGTNVPDGVEAEVKAMTTSLGQLAVLDGVDKGGQIFLSVWSDHQINVPGAPVKTGNWSAQFKTVNIPGTATEVTTMVQYDYKGGPSGDPVGKVILTGDCETPPPSPQEPTVEITYSEWVDGEYTCDATVVPQTRTKTVTTTTYTPTLIDGQWVQVANTPTTETTTEQGSRPLTPEEQETADVECAGQQPENKVTYGEWEAGEYECDDTEYTETRTVSTTTYERVGADWVAQEPVVTTESRTVAREADCPVTPPTEEPTEEPTQPPSVTTPPATLATTGATFNGLIWALSTALGATLLGIVGVGTARAVRKNKS